MFYKVLMRFLPTSYELLTNYLWISYELLYLLQTNPLKIVELFSLLDLQIKKKTFYELLAYFFITSYERQTMPLKIKIKSLCFLYSQLFKNVLQTSTSFLQTSYKRLSN
jgi:hypothetical protein